MAGARARAAQSWAAIETSDYVRAVLDEVVRRRGAGDSRAPQHVALDALEEVWVRTGSRRLANLAYRRTLAIARGALPSTRGKAPRGVVLPSPRRPQAAGASDRDVANA